ncbi:FG-GAP-like repeat-containing protein [Actinoplanes sp. NBC_00393]|uniref:FG-GAP-like repeat-containing protein n=1 Tax=Actinoplanes sp. NBC_00393 TaxID=2975953 RepID=UPI002E1C6552
MTASHRALTRRLLTAGLAAVTLTTTVPAVAHAAPAGRATAAYLALADYDQKLAVAVKFGFGDDFELIERDDRDFVIGLWTLLKENPDFLEVTLAAERAFTTSDPQDPEAADRACHEFIVTGVHAAYDRDVAREQREAEAKRQSDVARTAAAASIDVIADAALLNGTDAQFIQQIWERVLDDPDWVEVKNAAAEVRDGTPEEQKQFIASGMAAAAKEAVERRIREDDEKTEAQKAAELARAAKQLAANRIGLPVTEQLLNLPDRDFVTEVWNFAQDGSEVQAAAVDAARSNDPAVWKTFIATGIHQAKDRDIQIALDKKYQADRALAEQLKATATANGDLNLLHATTRALAGTPTQLDTFLRVGQYDLDLRTGFESGDVQPTWSNSPAAANAVVNVSKAALGVGTGTGHTGGAALVYSGSDDNTLQSSAYLRSMALSRITVKPATTLSYWIKPDSSTARPGVKTRNSTCVAIDLVFSDGTYLRDSGLKDQRGNRIHPAHQCSKLTADQWNLVVVPLGSALAGKQVTGLNVGYEQSNNIGGYRGLIDDITISESPVDPGEPGTVPNYPVDKPVRDFNSDGLVDVVGRTAQGELRLYRGNGKNGFLDDGVSFGSGFSGFTAVFSSGDFDRDGLADVIGRNSAGTLLLYRGNGKGGYVDGRGISIGTGWSSLNSLFSPGDFDRDGFTDVIGRTSQGELLLYRGNGKDGFLNSNGISVGTGWSSLNSLFSPSDFDRDGLADVIARNSLGDLLLYRGNGKNGFLNARGIVIGTGWNGFNTLLSAGDFDNDGLADVIGRTTSGELRLYRGDGKDGFLNSGTAIGSGWQGLNLIF